MMRLNNNGFILFEALAACALIAFFASLCIVPYRLGSFLTARLEIENLLSLCNYLQQRAVIEQQEYVLLLDPKSGTYSYENETYELHLPITFDILKQVKGPPASPTQYLQKPITFLQNKITFFPSGIISSGTVYLLDTDADTLYAITNSVSQHSYLRLYRYADEWEIIY
jgi:hypothetical protein